MYASFLLRSDIRGILPRILSDAFPNNVFVRRALLEAFYR